MNHENLKKKLGFKIHDVINTKEQTVISTIKDAFEGENMQTQYTVLGYRIDLYFHQYKLAIEVDELGHSDRSADYEIQRQRALERELDCVFIRINPDAVDFNIHQEINKIRWHINQSTIQQTEQKAKESVIGNLSKRLLELELTKNNQIKAKCLKWIPIKDKKGTSIVNAFQKIISKGRKPNKIWVDRGSEFTINLLKIFWK